MEILHLTRQPTPSQQSSRLALPFEVSYAERTDIPRRTQNLKDLTALLLLTRQRGRFSEFHYLIDRIPDSTPVAYRVKFNGQPVAGLRLFFFTEDKGSTDKRPCH